MTMTAADGLIIQLAADVARLRADMSEANRVVQGGASTMGNAMGGLKNMINGLAAGMSVAAFAGWINGAIDAADATKEFSQKTGVAIKDVAGLQLGFRQGGVESEALLGSIAKLSKNMAEGSEGFKKLGIETRNSDGSMRNVKDVIYDVADATKAMGNTTERAVILQDLFGKSAQALIPTLDGGSEGLRDMADMAERLGLVIDDKTADAADQFGDTLDLLHDSSKGMATQMAAQLLPTLNAITGAMLSTEDKSDNLKIAADALAIVLKTLYTAGVLVGGAVKTLGGDIGATAAAIMTAARGDFSGAMNIMKDRAKDAENEWKDRLKGIANVWKETSNTTVTAVAEMNAQQKKNVVQTKEQETAVKDADKSYNTFKNGLISYRNELQNQLSAGDKLSKAQKVLADLTANNTDEVKKLSTARREELIALAKENIQYENQAKVVDEATKATKKLHDELVKKNRTIDDEIQKQRESNAEIENGKEASMQLEVAKLREQAAIAESNAAKAVESGLNQDITGEYIKQAEKLRELADLKEKGIHIQAAKDSAIEWKKTTDSIGDGLTDALMRGFESGKGFGQNFKDTLVNMFKTMVLQPKLKAIVGGASDFVGKLGTSFKEGSVGGVVKTVKEGVDSAKAAIGAMGSMGVWGLAAAGAVAAAGVWNKSQAAKLVQYSSDYRQKNQNTGTVLGMSGAQSDSTAKALASMDQNSHSLLDVNYGMYKSLLAIQDGITGASTGFAKQIGLNGSGVQGIKTGTSTFGWLDQGGAAGKATSSMIAKVFGGGPGGINNMIAGFMSSVTGAISKAIYSSKTSITDSGIQFDGGNLGDIMDGKTLQSRNYAEVKNVKKVFGINAGQSVKTQTASLDEVVQKQFSDIFKSSGEALKEAAKAFGKDGDAFVRSLKIDSSKLSLKDLSGDAMAKQIEAFFSSNLDRWAKQLVSDSDALLEFQQVGEGAFQTVIRLASQLNTFNDATTKLNLNMHQTGLDAIHTSQALADMAGGFDALQKSMDDYYNNFYSDGEKAADQAVRLHNALTSVGVTSMPRTREEFRKLVEAQDLTTESGREMFTNLMNVQGVFAELVPASLRLTATLGELMEMNNLGGVFSKVANLSADARENLLSFTGGIEAFIQKTQQFVSDYYSEDEKMAIEAKKIRGSLDGSGIDINSIRNKDDFRKVVESVDLNTEDGRRLLALLLDIAPSFAQIGEYIKAKDTNLGDLAAKAPQTELLSSILDGSKSQVDKTQQVTEAITKLDSTMVAVGDKIAESVDRMSSSIVQQNEEYYRRMYASQSGYQ